MHVISNETTNHRSLMQTSTIGKPDNAYAANN